MKLILREDVEHLGKGGELVEVKPGYGRNYLLPRGLAVAANPKNVRELEHQRALAARGLQLDRRALDLREPIKTVGDFEVPVKLHRDVVGKAKVKVEAETARGARQGGGGGGGAPPPGGPAPRGGGRRATPCGAAARRWARPPAAG